MDNRVVVRLGGQLNAGRLANVSDKPSRERCPKSSQMATGAWDNNATPPIHYEHQTSYIYSRYSYLIGLRTVFQSRSAGFKRVVLPGFRYLSLGFGSPAARFHVPVPLGTLGRNTSEGGIEMRYCVASLISQSSSSARFRKLDWREQTLGEEPT